MAGPYRCFVFLFALVALLLLAGCVNQTPTLPENIAATVYIASFLAVIAIILFLVAAATAITGLLIIFGVISSSIFAGWITARPIIGLRTFLTQILILAAIPLAMLATWIITNANHWPYSFGKIVLSGAISGTLAGLLLAFLLRHLVRFLARRVFPSQTNPTSRS